MVGIAVGVFLLSWASAPAGGRFGSGRRCEGGRDVRRHARSIDPRWPPAPTGTRDGRLTNSLRHNVRQRSRARRPMSAEGPALASGVDEFHATSGLGAVLAVHDQAGVLGLVVEPLDVADAFLGPRTVLAVRASGAKVLAVALLQGA